MLHRRHSAADPPILLKDSVNVAEKQNKTKNKKTTTLMSPSTNLQGASNNTIFYHPIIKQVLELKYECSNMHLRFSGISD